MHLTLSVGAFNRAARGMDFVSAEQVRLFILVAYEIEKVA